MHSHFQCAECNPPTFFMVLKLRLDSSVVCHMTRSLYLQTLMSARRVRTSVHLKIVVSTITAPIDVPVHLGTAPHQTGRAAKVCES